MFKKRSLLVKYKLVPKPEAKFTGNRNAETVGNMWTQGYKSYHFLFSHIIEQIKEEACRIYLVNKNHIGDYVYIDIIEVIKLD